MNQSNQDTDDILDAIKLMMGNDQINSNQSLPKDVMELTKPVDEKEIRESETSILELTELVRDDLPDKKGALEAKEMQISEDQIRNVVRNTIASLPKVTIDNIINEELKRVILDKLSSAKISLSSQDNKE
jgi:hypothetical protein